MDKRADLFIEKMRELKEAEAGFRLFYNPIEYTPMGVVLGGETEVRFSHDGMQIKVWFTPDLRIEMTLCPVEEDPDAATFCNEANQWGAYSRMFVKDNLLTNAYEMPLPEDDEAATDLAISVYLSVKAEAAARMREWEKRKGY